MVLATVTAPTTDSLTFTILASRAGSPSRPNEDRVGATDNAAWVLDGATGLADQRLFNKGDSDPAHFANHVSDLLAKHLPTDTRPLVDVVDTVTQMASRDLTADMLRPVGDPMEVPMAAATVVRWNEREVDLYSLADCRVLVRDGSGTVVDFSDGRLRPYDHQNIKRFMRLVKQGLDWKEARAKIAEHVRATRRLANTPDGYWALAFGPNDAARYGKCLTLQRDEQPLELLLMSDGFSRLLEFGRFRSPETLVEFVAKFGPDAALNELRRLEAKDPNCRRYPRLKPSDDASCVYVRLAGI